MPEPRTVVLASASPRRRELLSLTGLRFIVDPSDYEEDLLQALPPRKLARVLSQRKAESVAARHPHAIVIGADTFIVFEGSLMGKPRSKAEAVAMLRRLSGRTHLVITGFTILDVPGKRRRSQSVVTRVTFRHLTDREIAAYVRSGEPMDKAGAYAIQGRAALFVKKIAGDYFNVIGLPLCALAERLRDFGVIL